MDSQSKTVPLTYYALGKRDVSANPPRIPGHMAEPVPSTQSSAAPLCSRNPSDGPSIKPYSRVDGRPKSHYSVRSTSFTRTSHDESTLNQNVHTLEAMKVVKSREYAQ